MSEPIILTERERAVFAELVSHLMGEANNRDTERAWQLGEVLRAWLRDMEPPTESASPPRVPGASAHGLQVGVESGPGQPIVGSTTGRINAEEPRAVPVSTPRSQPLGAAGVESSPGQPIDICERLDNLAQQGHRIGYPTCGDIAEAAAEIRRLRAEIAAMDSLLTRTFDDLGVLREQVKTERRAGVEAAAQYCIEGDVLLPGQAKAMVRALADKPALSDKGG